MYSSIAFPVTKSCVFAWLARSISAPLIYSLVLIYRQTATHSPSDITNQCRSVFVLRSLAVRRSWKMRRLIIVGFDYRFPDWNGSFDSLTPLWLPPFKPPSIFHLVNTDLFGQVFDALFWWFFGSCIFCPWFSSIS